MARHRIVAAAAGGGMLLVGIALLVLLPRDAPHLADGFRTPVIAFEFARTPADVEGLFMREDRSLDEAQLDSMDAGNGVDHLFLLLYGVFLATTASLVAKRAGNVYRVAGGLAIVAAGSDAFENAQLLAITRALRAGTSYDAHLQLLAQATHAKWGALVIALVWLSPWLLRNGSAGKSAAFFAWAAAVCGAAAVAYPGALHEGVAFAVTAAFVAAWIVVLRLPSNQDRVERDPG